MKQSAAAKAAVKATKQSVSGSKVRDEYFHSRCPLTLLHLGFYKQKDTCIYFEEGTLA
jgi:hypothetical protein